MRSSHFYDLRTPVPRWNLVSLNTKKGDNVLCTVDDSASDDIRPAEWLVCYWTITTPDISPPLGPRAVSSEKVERADQLQWSSCTKVRRCFCVRQLIWLEPMSFLGRCSACVFWMVSHQLPKQLPKLHLMPIKPVSLPLPPDCMWNIKKLSDPFSTLADISAKVLGNYRWTLSPHSCASAWKVCTSVYQGLHARMRKGRNFHARCQRKIVRKLLIQRLQAQGALIYHVRKASQIRLIKLALHGTRGCFVRDLIHDILSVHLCCLPFKGVLFKRHWGWTRGGWRGHGEVGASRFRDE